MTISQALGDKVQEFRAARGWSQRELGRRLNLTQSSVSSFLRSKRRAGVLLFYERLAALMGLPLSGLFAEVEARVHADRSGGGEPMSIRVTETPAKGVLDAVGRRSLSQGSFAERSCLSPAQDEDVDVLEALILAQADQAERDALALKRDARALKRAIAVLRRQQDRQRRDADRPGVAGGAESTPAAPAPRSEGRRQATRQVPA